MSRPDPLRPGRAPGNSENTAAEQWDLSPSSTHLIEAAEGYHMIGMHQAALEEVSALPEADQAHPKALHLLSRIYWALGDVDRAFEPTDAFIRLQPDHPFGYIFRAMLLTSAGQHSKAYDFLKAVIGNFPGHATMHYDLARAAASCALWAEARHWVYLAICSQHSLKQVAIQTEVFAPIKEAVEAMEPLS